jgi:hypothetical protein
MKRRRNDVETIRRRMAQIRRKHHTDVREVIAGAETVAGWGRHIWLFSWTALGAAAVCWMIANRGRTGPMKQSAPYERAQDKEQSKAAQPPILERATTFPSLLASAGSFLTSVVVRAAQNYAACCLEEWISPRHVPETSRDGPILPGDDLSAPVGPRRPWQSNGDRGKIGSELLVGGSQNDRSHS